MVESTWISLAALLLSIINSLVLLWRRKTRISVGSAVLVFFEDQFVYLDLIIQNKSSITVTIDSVTILFPFQKRARNNRLGLSTLKPKNKPCVHFCSELPLRAESYLSTRCVLQFSPLPLFQRFRKHTQHSRLWLLLDTSRGKKLTLCFADSTNKYEAWMRSFVD